MQPTPIPQLLNPPDLHQFNHGVSLLGGWLPVTVEIITVIALIVLIGRWTRRWRLLWFRSASPSACWRAGRPHRHERRGLASDPAPLTLWIWVAVCAGAIAVAVLGWRRRTGGGGRCRCWRFRWRCWPR